MSPNPTSNKDSIIVRGARVNNLKNINVEVPRNKLVVITGLSGSGKSSLAFDAIFAEGNRRYLEGMSSFARQFLDVSAKPDVDKIENLSPTIAIDQKSVSRSPRSTVGTMTEIYDYLRVLFSKMGVPHCPHCHIPMGRVTSQEILEEILVLPNNTSLVILSEVQENGRDLADRLKSVSQLGYARVRFNGQIMLLQEALQKIDEPENNRVEIVIDRLILKQKDPDKERILDSLETAFKIGHGFIIVSLDNREDKSYNRDFVCRECLFKISEITPKHFSFNNPEGACSHCSGLGVVKEIDEILVIPNKKLTLAEGAILPWSKSGGKFATSGNGMAILRALGKKYKFSVDVPVKNLSRKVLETIFYGGEDQELFIKQPNGGGTERETKIRFEGIIPFLKKKYEEASFANNKCDLERYMTEKVCPVCQGKRLREEYLSVLVADKSIDEISKMSLEKFALFLEELEKSDRSVTKKEITLPLVKEMKLRTEALLNVGLEYLSLSRGANSLSGGEGQRIRLAVQIGSELMGIVYILDEPSIGLHNRDTKKLIETMIKLKEMGNSLIVVEHDEEIMDQADWIIDLGPGAGIEGGQVIFEGPMKKMLQAKTLTAQYLMKKKRVTEKKKIRKGNGKSIDIIGASEHNLKNIDISIPLGKFVAITGVSGSGKSTLTYDILSKSLAKHFFGSRENPGKYKNIRGLDNVDKVITVNQAPIGRTPRSNAATYTGVFSLIRDIFANTEESIKRGYEASRFSFNMKGGRCEDCQGEGIKKIEMHLLPDVYVKCETCRGTRYNQKTLDIEYQGANIADVLDMSVSYALRFFHNHPLITEKLRTLEEVGLGYLKLGQSATNLSGGEAQRIKLATELARKSTGKTLYILDEPTIGLHFEDVKKLLYVLDALVDKGNTVLVIEHNLEVVKNSDWIIDLGPDGGDKGGEVVYAGMLAGLKKCTKSWTGRCL